MNNTEYQYVERALYSALHKQHGASAMQLARVTLDNRVRTALALVDMLQSLKELANDPNYLAHLNTINDVIELLVPKQEPLIKEVIKYQTNLWFAFKQSLSNLFQRSKSNE